jgi:hypothetical protein
MKKNWKDITLGEIFTECKKRDGQCNECGRQCPMESLCIVTASQEIEPLEWEVGMEKAGCEEVFCGQD